MIGLAEAPGAYVEMFHWPAIGWILHNVYVPPELRGRGYGSALLARAIASVPDGERIHLAPIPDEDCPIDVVAWYERHGFAWGRGTLMERAPR